MLSRTAFRALTVPSSRTVAPRLPSRASARPLAPSPAVRALCSSASLRSAGQADAQLADKLKQELQFEQESGSTTEPEWLAQFKKEEVFTIEDKAGSDEVALTRTYGNETIRVVFSVADVEEPGFTAAEEDGEEAGEPSTEAGAEAAQAAEDESEPAGIRTAIIISKDGKGAITFDALADETGFAIDNVSFYDDEATALDTTRSESEWKRRSAYIGPTFDNLDEDLQAAFEEFLDERGVTSSLAQVIGDLAEYKEQKEYVRWLDQVQRWTDA